MKKVLRNYGWFLRFILLFVLYFATCIYLNLLVYPWPRETARALLAIPVIYAVTALCFFPEIQKFCRRCAQATKTEGDRSLALANLLVSFIPVYFIALRAQVLLRLDRYDEARADANICIRLAPDLLDAWITRAKIAAELYDYDAALADVEQALQRAPESAYALTMRAYVYSCRHEWRACLNDCERIDALGEISDYVRFLKMDCYLNGNFHEAEKFLKAIPTKIKPESLDAYSICRFDLIANRYEDVLRMSEKASTGEKYAYWFLNHQALAYSRLNQGRRALETVARAMELKPKLANSYYVRAGILADAGYLDDALADCFTTEAARNKWFLRNVEGYVRYRRNEYEEMLECSRHTLHLLPESVIGLALNGLALANLGNLDEGAAAVRAAVDLNNLSAFAWYGLARVQLMQNLPDQAVKSAESGLSVDPHYRFLYHVRSEAHRLGGQEVAAAEVQAKFDQLQGQFMADFTFGPKTVT